MTITQRRALLAGLLIGFVACFGCNPLLLPQFFQGEAQDPAVLKRLTDKEDKTKEVKVAVVVSSRLDARQELRNVNRELCRKTTDQIRALAKANEEKLVVVEPAKVERFLANNPDWKNMDHDQLADEMKRALKVDYVIDVEIITMSLYEHGNHELLRGRADLHVALYDVHDADAGTEDKDLHSLYPNERAGPEQADSDTNVFQFREKFLDILAKKIAYCFCDHATISQMDDSREGTGE